MNRAELEHIIRASSAITQESEFIIVGSQAILGKHPDAPRSLRQSIEADIFPRNNVHLSDLIDGSIGELSHFHREFGYYAHGIGPESVILARGWEDRLIAVKNANTRQAVGYCLSPLDIAYSKLAAGRKKDLDYLNQLLSYQFISKIKLLKLIKETEDCKRRVLLEQNYSRLDASKTG